MALRESRGRNSIKTTLILLILFLGLLLAGTGVLFWMLAGDGVFWYRLIGSVLLAVMLSVVLVTLLSVVAFHRLWYNKSVNRYILIFLILYLQWFYPAIEGLGKLLNYDKDEIRRAYTQMNNRALLSGNRRFMADEILILTPHCLQQSSCGIKITNDISLCQECGACDIEGLIAIRRRLGIETVVVTGGTLARKKIQEKNPSLIIAIACERDLISGLMDIKKIPVYALINDRPEGPCQNTRVSLDEVEWVIKQLIRGDKNDISA